MEVEQHREREGASSQPGGTPSEHPAPVVLGRDTTCGGRDVCAQEAYRTPVLEVAQQEGRGLSVRQCCGMGEVQDLRDGGAQEGEGGEWGLASPGYRPPDRGTEE